MRLGELERVLQQVSDDGGQDLSICLDGHAILGAGHKARANVEVEQSVEGARAHHVEEALAGEGAVTAAIALQGAVDEEDAIAKSFLERAAPLWPLERR